VGGVLAGGVSLWAVSPRVVFPPAVFGGCPPPVLLSRVAASFHCLMCSPVLCSLASRRLADLPATDTHRGG